MDCNEGMLSQGTRSVPAIVTAFSISLITY